MNLSTDDNSKQTISDDQELAKVLAGVVEETDNMKFEETGNTPTPPLGGAPDPSQMTPPAAATPDPAAVSMPDPIAPTTPDPVVPTQSVATDTQIDPALASVKQEALTELRPLIDKLDVEPEEKFNTYLLLIRSTDDKDLIAPAHEAAKAIVDEAKKAQALLDIIKEIDFLSSPKQ